MPTGAADTTGSVRSVPWRRGRGPCRLGTRRSLRRRERRRDNETAGLPRAWAWSRAMATSIDPPSARGDLSSMKHALKARPVAKLPDKVRLQGRILFLAEDAALVRQQLEGRDLDWRPEHKLRDDIS